MQTREKEKDKEKEKELAIEKETELSDAVINGNIDEVLTLLQAGVSANSCDTWGTPLLIQAMCSRSQYKIEIIKLLIFYHADVNIGQASLSPLVRAIEGKSSQIAKILIESGADLLITDNAGNTALHLAIHAKQDDIVLLILEKATPDLLIYVNRRGETALFLAAVVLESKKMVKMLLDAGAPDLPNSQGITAEIASRNNGIRSLIQKAREAGELHSSLQAFQRAQALHLNRTYASEEAALVGAAELVQITLQALKNNIHFLTQNQQRLPIDYQEDLPDLVKQLSTLVTSQKQPNAKAAIKQASLSLSGARTLFSEKKEVQKEQQETKNGVDRIEKMVNSSSS